MGQDEARTIVRRIIGDNIRMLREEQHVSQAALAEQAGIDLSYLGRIERGTENASMDIVVSIADALDCPLLRLFKGLDECPP